jgi:hypothetical protein
MKTTTIQELSHTHKINDQQVRLLLIKNNILPIKNNKVVINGFSGRAYYSELCEPIMTAYVNSNAKPKRNEIIKKHSIIEVLNVLRKDVKHVLWNKEIKNWNVLDWREFQVLQNQ